MNGLRHAPRFFRSVELFRFGGPETRLQVDISYGYTLITVNASRGGDKSGSQFQPRHITETIKEEIELVSLGLKARHNKIYKTDVFLGNLI